MSTQPHPNLSFKDAIIDSVGKGFYDYYTENEQVFVNLPQSAVSWDVFHSGLLSRLRVDAFYSTYR